MKIRSRILLACAAVSLVGVASKGARAQAPTLFATFGQAVPAPAFQFRSTAGIGSLGLASPLAVNFQFQTANGYSASIGDNIMASLTMSSQTVGPAFMDAGQLVQPLANVDMRFTSPSAPADSGDLLHVFLTTGYLSGSPGGQTAVLSGTQSPTGTSIVNFDSKYLDFSIPLINKNFALSFTSVDPKIAMGSDGNFAPFNATGTGNFGSSPRVPSRNIPEPGTLALAGTGLAGLVARRRR